MRLSLEAQNTIVTAAEEAMVAEETTVAAGLHDETSDQKMWIVCDFLKITSTITNNFQNHLSKLL